MVIWTILLFFKQIICVFCKRSSYSSLANTTGLSNWESMTSCRSTDIKYNKHVKDGEGPWRRSYQTCLLWGAYAVIKLAEKNFFFFFFRLYILYTVTGQLLERAHFLILFTKDSRFWSIVTWSQVIRRHWLNTK